MAYRLSFIVDGWVPEHEVFTGYVTALREMAAQLKHSDFDILPVPAPATPLGGLTLVRVNLAREGEVVGYVAISAI